MKTVPLGTQVVVHALTQLHVCGARVDVSTLLLEQRRVGGLPDTEGARVRGQIRQEADEVHLLADRDLGGLPPFSRIVTSSRCVLLCPAQNDCGPASATTLRDLPSACVGAKRLIFLGRSGRRLRLPIKSVAFREALLPPPVAGGCVSALAVVVTGGVFGVAVPLLLSPQAAGTTTTSVSGATRRRPRVAGIDSLIWLLRAVD
jgi:hypothetical protein